MITGFRIWWVGRKRYLSASDLAFLVRAAEEGYDVPKITGVGPAEPFTIYNNDGTKHEHQFNDKGQCYCGSFVQKEPS